MTVVKKKHAEQPVSDAVVTGKETSVIEKNAIEVVDQTFSSEEKKHYQTLCTEIGKELSKVESSALSIALKINTIYRNKLYQVGNYANIYDMVSSKFGLGRASCNNYINICTNFCEFDKEKNLYTGLDPKYKKYSMSQLVAMLPMDQKMREEVTPDMSVREIKRKRQIHDERSQIADNEANLDMSKAKKKQKRLELIRSQNVPLLSEEEKDMLQQKLVEFEEAHPDVSYMFSINIVYEK